MGVQMLEGTALEIPLSHLMTLPQMKSNKRRSLSCLVQVISRDPTQKMPFL